MKVNINISKKIGIFSIIALCLLGCTNIDDSITVNSVNMDFERIGQEHNKGLDYIYEQLKKIQDNNDIKLSRVDNIFDIVEDASVLFVNKSDCGQGIEKEKVSKIINSTSERISLRNANVDNITNPEELVFLSDKQQYYLNKCKKIIMSIENDLNPVIKKLKNLDAEIISNCTSEEAEPLLAATSVSRHSLQYWNDNLYKWAALFNEEQKQSNFIPMLKSGTEVQTNDDEWNWFKNTLISMGESDGVGALVGGLMGLTAGGVGAVPGALVGACNASAGAGIKALFQRWGIFP